MADFEHDFVVYLTKLQRNNLVKIGYHIGGESKGRILCAEEYLSGGFH